MRTLAETSTSISNQQATNHNQGQKVIPEFTPHYVLLSVEAMPGETVEVRANGEQTNRLISVVPTPD